jgi:hypothetical protein
VTSLAAIRAGLAANLQAVAGVEQVSAYVLANPTPPTLWVRPSSDVAVEYGQAMGGGSTNWYMVVFGFVGAVSDIGAQKLLDEMIGTGTASSVQDAIETDKTLGGACSDLDVRECRAYQEYVRSDGSSVLGAEWDVYVICGA